MIPNLTFDREAARKNWSDYDDKEIDDIEKYSVAVQLTEDCTFEVHVSDNNWVDMGIYKEFKKTKRESVEYGYCSTQAAMAKYLQKYADDPDKNYYIYAHMLSMDNEKYYKFGSYINNDGVNTEDDYDWDNEEEQQFENEWIAFSVYELEKEEENESNQA